jgi:hypothetical protein
LADLFGTSITLELGARARSVGVAVGIVADEALVAFGGTLVVSGEVAGMAGAAHCAGSRGVALPPLTTKTSRSIPPPLLPPKRHHLIHNLDFRPALILLLLPLSLHHGPRSANLLIIKILLAPIQILPPRHDIDNISTLASASQLKQILLANLTVIIRYFGTITLVLLILLAEFAMLMVFVVDILVHFGIDE